MIHWLKKETHINTNATNIVMSLCEKVLDEGRCLFMNNWYSNLELLSVLRNRSTNGVGTVHKDRKGLLKDDMS